MAPLAVMRSLHPLGVRVYATATRRMSLWQRSRFCAGLFNIGEDDGPSRTDPEATIDGLLRAGRSLGGDTVLVPCSDEWALFVARHADRLARTYRFAELDHLLAQKLGNKQRMHELASEQGIGVPASVLPADRADAMRLASTLHYPVVLKTATTRTEGNQWAVVDGPEELVLAYDRLNDQGNLVCQHLVAAGDGDGWVFNGYFDAHSRCIARFSGRKLRQSPPRRGITVFAEAQPNPEIEEIAVRFLSAIGYCGAVDMDFVRDQVDGSYLLVDVNPRLGGVFRLFLDSHGLDIARAMYLDLIGQTPEQDGQQVDRRLVLEGGYIVETLKLVGTRQSTPAAVLREARRAELGTFRVTDPIPFLVHIIETIRLHTRGRPRLRRRRRIPSGAKHQVRDERQAS
jgi:predicted ATP-grasp superfamily ATP-dependent carboligase